MTRGDLLGGLVLVCIGCPAPIRLLDALYALAERSGWRDVEN